MEGLTRKILSVLFVLGLSAILSQLILIRELLNVFQGNELIIGFILFAWMLLTAAGSRLGQHFYSSENKLKIISRLFLAEGILPAIIILLLYLLDAFLFPTGTTKGFLIAVLYCMVFLLPGCFISGILFTWLAAILSERNNKNCVSNAYAWESAGSMTAGILFSLLLAYLMRTFQVLALVMLINLYAAWLLVKSGTPVSQKFTVFHLAMLILSVMMFIFPIDLWLKTLHHKNQHILLTKDTPYGSIVVTETNGQFNFYENSLLHFSTENHFVSEEAVHYAMLQHPEPKKVLIVTGGIAEMAMQVFKYPSVAKIDYLEINPWLVKAEKRFTQFKDMPALHVNIADARKWISQSVNEYDVIIVNSPDPSNAQLNRYFTVDFFQDAKQALKPHGVFSISLSPTVNYMSPDALEINKIIFNTLKAAFQHVDIIPGGRNYFLASERPIGLNISERVQHAGIENEFINAYYIDDALLLQQNRQIMENVESAGSRVNTDLTPLAYLLQIKYWINMVEGKKTMWILILTILVFIVLTFTASKRLSPVATGVFTTGLAGASAEFLILILYQILYGNVYLIIGLIVALYMLGLTIGAIIKSHESKEVTSRSYTVVQLFLMIAVMLVPAVISLARNHEIIPDYIIKGLLLLITAVIAFLAGLTFNKATRLLNQDAIKTAGNLYTVDLAGAATGTLGVSLFCFPLLGLSLTCLLIAGIVFLGIVIMLVFEKK
jgi:spermidine synthase